MLRFATPGNYGLLLEAEVAPGAQSRFEKRYLAATKQVVSPGAPQHYQTQGNKWGAELRVYFNDPGMAVSLAAKGLHVEHNRKGYLSGSYLFRVNDNKFFWKLVEDYGLHLGSN
jgi:hypothetical protein